jgi:hypothetical protein
MKDMELLMSVGSVCERRCAPDAGTSPKFSKIGFGEINRVGFVGQKWDSLSDSWTTISWRSDRTDS